MPTNPSLPVLPDIPDFRDRQYEPALLQLRDEIEPPEDLEILDQGQEGACTGFGLAGVINKLNQDRRLPVRVSARMLYQMAKKFDRWPGDEYSGSSCRGAIKGWYNMGVCSEALWPYKVNDTSSQITVPRAKDARSNTIGAYYRVRKNIVDMHAALNEVGAIYASANVHAGWRKNAVRGGAIKYRKGSIGGHAFAIVGYDRKGFFVQNSWGKSWGKRGTAHWSYEDWYANVHDAWVVQLALPTPELWGKIAESGAGGSGAVGRAEFGSGTRRDEIAGHFVHLDDGEFHDEGRYWSTLSDVRETASHLATSTKYDHLLLYAHGGLNGPKDSAKRIAAMREVFKKNGIYPFHFMYDTGLGEELKDVILNRRSSTEELVGGFSDWWDRVIENITRRPGRRVWREMKFGAESPFKRAGSDGSQAVKAFVDAFRRAGARPKSIHVVGHSTGAILLAHLLTAMKGMNGAPRVKSASLLAPAAAVQLYKDRYIPLLNAPAGRFGIDALKIYNLSKKLEKDDSVALVYRKSLLYLVSNAFEETRGDAILGMMKFKDKVPSHRRAKVLVSRGKGRGTTRSESHGGFDNDRYTMNDVLKTVLGKRPTRPFTDADLDY